ncbi:hypothetical protein [Chamaesiphon sp. GL140_3_metabinner_50]|nr:hypothetical protein [Chamaesiphon sp. GL140_3_metabinner_50]
MANLQKYYATDRIDRDNLLGSVEEIAEGQKMRWVNIDDRRIDNLRQK